MLFGKNPFLYEVNDKSSKMTFKQFRNLQRQQIKFPSYISDSAKDLIQKMLVRDS